MRKYEKWIYKWCDEKCDKKSRNDMSKIKRIVDIY